MMRMVASIRVYTVITMNEPENLSPVGHREKGRSEGAKIFKILDRGMPLVLTNLQHIQYNLPLNTFTAVRRSLTPPDFLFRHHFSQAARGTQFRTIFLTSTLLPRTIANPLNKYNCFDCKWLLCCDSRVPPYACAT
jgi:hypothetical protein